MITIHKDDNLQVIVTENYQESLASQKGNFVWFTKDEKSYDFLTKTLNQTFILFVYEDGYVMSLIINKKNRTFEKWVDNVINGKTFASIQITGFDGKLFEYEKLKQKAESIGSKGIKLIADKIEALDPIIIQKVEDYL